MIVTVGIAFVVIVIALILMGIGWLVTGKSKMEAGACGRAPKQDIRCGKDTTCPLCEKKEEE